MRAILFFIILISTPRAVHGQTDSLTGFRCRGVGVAMGLGYNRLIDEGLTYDRTLFSGGSFNIQLDYTISKEKFIFSTRMLAHFGNAKADEGKLKTKFYQAEIALSGLWKIKQNQLFGRAGKLYAGPELSMKALVLENMDRLDNIDMLVMHALYLKVQQQLYLGPGKLLCVRLILPIAAFVKHENLNGLANQEMTEMRENLGSLLLRNATFEIPSHLRFQSDYIKRIAPGTDVFLQYNFSYIATTVNTPLNVYSNELLAGLRFYFKS